MSGSETPVAPERMTLDWETSVALWDMRCSGLLCDGLLKTSDGGAFLVHRVIMAGCSEYFGASFGVRLNSQERYEILVPGVSCTDLEIIVEFAYKHVTKLGSENVESILKVADYLRVSDLVKECCEFLRSRLTNENCLSIHNIATLYNCSELATTTYRHLMKHFVEIANHSEEFLGLKIDDVESLLADENLNVLKEGSVWKAALRWVEFDLANREQHTARLLKCVRTGLVDMGYFAEKIKMNQYVIGSTACKPIIIDTLRYFYNLDFVGPNDEVVTPALAQPRIPHDVTFVIGGWIDGRATTLIESYDSKADRWVKVESVDPAGPRAYHKCAVIGYDIYVIGGFDGVDHFSSVRCFNAHTKTWRSVTPMHAKRGYVSVAVLNDIIYAMGGYDGRLWLNSAEKFDYRHNQWTFIASMKQQRSDACATTHNGYVYVTGGFSGSECLSSAERYDPEFDQWTAIASMRYRRNGVGCIGFRDSIYVMGGFSGHSKLSSAEKYNPKTNTWTPIPDMCVGRSNLAVAIVDNMVCAIGGCKGERSTNRVECYDPSTEQWYEATVMNKCRQAMAACVISGLPNNYDYIHQRRDNLFEEKRQVFLNITRKPSRHLTRVNREDHREE